MQIVLDVSEAKELSGALYLLPRRALNHSSIAYSIAELVLLLVFLFEASLFGSGRFGSVGFASLHCCPLTFYVVSFHLVLID